MLKYKFKKHERGIGALEAIISLAVITTATASVILVVFGNQDIELDNEVNNIALYHASEMIEEAQASASANFDSIVGFTNSFDIFSTQLLVSDISPCRKDVTASISWSISGRPLHSYLETSSVNEEESEALGGDCDLSGGPITEWWFPLTYEDYDLGSMNPSALQAGNNGVGATSIDLINKGGSKYAVLTTDNNSEDDIWVINVDDPDNAFIVSSVETEVVGVNNGDAVGDLVFALAEGSFSTQPSELQIIDISTITSPILLATKSLGISGVDSSNNPNADAVFYYDGKVYVGTHRTGGPELQIYNATTPFNLIASLEITHNVNDIVVSGDYAYLATSDDGFAINGGAGELMVVNINPASPNYMLHPDTTGMWFDTPGAYDGKSLYYINNKIYLGREKADESTDNSNPNFYIFDVSDPLSIVELGSKRITRNPSQLLDVLAIQVVAKFAFLGTSDSNAEFQVFNVEDPSNIKNCNEDPPPGYSFPPEGCGKYNFPAKITDIEYSDNYIYSSIESNETFRIIFDDPSQY